MRRLIKNDINFESLWIAPEDIAQGLDFVFKKEAALEVEIGAGNARVMLHSAHEFPERNFLVIERMRGRLRRATTSAVKSGLENIYFTPFDAEDILPKLPDESVSVFHFYYPDPWPKRKQQKHRFLNAYTAKLLADKMTSNGELFVATDHKEYFDEQIMVWLGAEKRLSIQPTQTTPTRGIPTDFEEKFAQQDNRVVYRAHFKK